MMGAAAGALTGGLTATGIAFGTAGLMHGADLASQGLDPLARSSSPGLQIPARLRRALEGGDSAYISSQTNNDN